MSSDVQIDDEEGLVDRQTKQQVLTLREQVDEDERLLYVERMSDPENPITAQQADEYWGVSVRQYLRSIKRLWNSAAELELATADRYWKETELGTETLVPPDSSGYEFSIVGRENQYAEADLKQYLGLPRDTTLPQPHQKTFTGLRDVLNTSHLSKEWIVTVNNQGPPPLHDRVRLEAETPVPKHILENAIEAADAFLQESGIGFEVDVPAYRGGEKPGL